MVIKRIAPLSAAKIAELIYALIGLPFALIILALSLAGLSNPGLSGSPLVPALGPVSGAVAMVVLPIVYGVSGFVMTLIGAWLYNLMAGFAGGLRIEVQMDASPEVIIG